MRALKAETKALLDLGREGDDPSDELINQNRSRLAAKIGGAALGTGVVIGTASQAAAASAAGAWVSTKLGLAGIVSGLFLVGGAGLGAYALFGAEPAARPSAQPAVSAASQSHPKRPKVAKVEREVARETAPQASGSAREPIGAAPPEPPRSSSTSAATPENHSIQHELKLIRAAQRHLHRNEPRAALARLAEHARRFPSGVLSEEREASRVFALCQLGDVVGARARAKRFVQRSPNSPFVERVRASCRAKSREAAETQAAETLGDENTRRRKH